MITSTIPGEREKPSSITIVTLDESLVLRTSFLVGGVGRSTRRRLRRLLSRLMLAVSGRLTGEDPKPKGHPTAHWPLDLVASNRVGSAGPANCMLNLESPWESVNNGDASLLVLVANQHRQAPRARVGEAREILFGGNSDLPLCAAPIFVWVCSSRGKGPCQHIADEVAMEMGGDGGSGPTIKVEALPRIAGFRGGRMPPWRV